MAENAASSSAAPPPEDLAVNISIVSPSVSVNAPLNFPGLPPSTTIGQLKQKIRDVLDAKPSNEQQRLIHQGKLLARESETLLELFGEQRIRDSDQMVVHLVIRDLVDHHPSSSQTTAPRRQSPAPNPDLHRAPNPLFGINPQAIPHNQPLGHHAHQHAQHARFARPMAPPGPVHSPFTGPGFGMQPPPGAQPSAQLVAQQQHLLQQYMEHINQRAGMMPGQQARAGLGHGVGGPDQAGNPHFSPGNNNRGRNSPHPHPYSHPDHQPQPYVREGIGPNGEFYRVTMNSAFIGPNGQVHPVNMPNLQANMPPGAGGSFSTNDVQNIFRYADANQATSMMTDAMHRSASGASLANLNLSNQRQPIQTPGVTVPRRPGSAVPLSRTATPDQIRTPSYGSASFPANSAMRSATPNQPEVYILNSPQGPRALLINSPSELFYTPAGRTSATPMMPAFTPAWFQPQPRTGTGADAVQPPAQAQAAAAPAQPQAPQQGNIRVNLFQGPAAQQPAQQQQQQQHVLARAVDHLHHPPAFAQHPANPEGGLAGALLAALWPHLWLLIRLAVFVWWFTTPDTSWTRWLMIMSVAMAVFLVNTGLFNRMANEMFNPVRQHLEGLIPLGGPERNRERGNNPAGQEVNNNDPAAQAGRQQGEPDPAQVAARLVEQHRERNANWLLNQIRRLERAGLLFLASIAPGVAERHIAHLEAEARAERDRQEAAERAEREQREEQERAAAAAAAAAMDGAGPAGEGDNGGGADGAQPNSDASASGGGVGGEQQQQHQQQPVAAV